MAESAKLTPAATSLSAEFSSIAAAFVEVADRARLCATTSRIASGDLERVLTAAIKLYAAKAETEALPPAPISADKITPTEAVAFISETMRAVNLNLFDLSMWYRRAR